MAVLKPSIRTRLHADPSICRYIVMELAVATNNTHKISELRAILPSHNLYCPADLGMPFSVEETGTSFLENALLKAWELYHLFQKSTDTSPKGASFREIPILADDSGLVVPVLAPKLGIYSARYGAEKGVDSDAGRLALLLEEMQGESDRSAFYLCAMILVVSAEVWYVAQEVWRGSIAKEAQYGRTGFGYDPAFVPQDTKVPVSRLSPQEKHRHSHRGKAVRAVMKMLQD